MNFWSSQWFTLTDCLKSLESACNINNCQCVLVGFLTSREPEEGREDQLNELYLEIQHHELVSGYASSQANKSARWIASSAKAL